MGHRVHDLSGRNRSSDPPVRLRAFPGRVAAGGDGGVLSRWEVAGAGDCGIAGTEETAGAVYAGGGGGAVGVRVLF